MKHTKKIVLASSIYAAASYSLPGYAAQEGRPQAWWPPVTSIAHHQQPPLELINSDSDGLTLAPLTITRNPDTRKERRGSLQREINHLKEQAEEFKIQIADQYMTVVNNTVRTSITFCKLDERTLESSAQITLLKRSCSDCHKNMLEFREEYQRAYRACTEFTKEVDKRNCRNTLEIDTLKKDLAHKDAMQNIHAHLNELDEEIQQNLEQLAKKQESQLAQQKIEILRILDNKLEAEKFAQTHSFSLLQAEILRLQARVDGFTLARTPKNKD